MSAPERPGAYPPQSFVDVDAQALLIVAMTHAPEGFLSNRINRGIWRQGNTAVGVLILILSFEPAVVVIDNSGHEIRNWRGWLHREKTVKTNSSGHKAKPHVGTLSKFRSVRVPHGHGTYTDVHQRVRPEGSVVALEALECPIWPAPSQGIPARPDVGYDKAVEEIDQVVGV